MGCKPRYSIKNVYRPEYQALVNAKHRCHNPEHRSYYNYGARGIQVCEEWRSEMGFYKFLEHVGPKPSPEHSLDRINNDGNYEPGNVRWEGSRKKQQANRRPTKRKLADLGWGFGYTAKGEGRGRGGKRSPMIPYKGGMWTLIEACKDAGFNSFTIRQRLERGMSVDDAFSLPLRGTGEKRRSNEYIATVINPAPTIH